MSAVYYDLSELFLAAGSKFKYYGIARTVLEVGYELAQTSADVRFVVFSPAHGCFFETTPRIGAAAANGLFDLSLPVEAKPLRIRQSSRDSMGFGKAFSSLFRKLAKQISLKKWNRFVPEGSVREVNLHGQILVSLGRPKMLADYLVALDNLNVRPRFFPLLHDMIPLHEFSHPRQSMFARNFSYDNRVVIEHAEKLLTNSVFTKDEIQRFSAAGRLPEIPAVEPVPLAHELRLSDEPVNIALPQTPYLLGVGVMTGRKNLECLLKALLSLHEAKCPVPTLVLAGASRKRTVKYVDKPEFAPIRDKITFIVDPNHAELRALYGQALALVIPSRMEGWGLPLGEALWLGTPGFAADVPALREVGGNLAEYFDPSDPQSLAALIEKIASDPKAHSDLKARIANAHGELRTWKDVADGIIGTIGLSQKMH